VPGRMEALDEATLSIWLQVSAGEAVARVQGGRTVRPLLAVEDPEARARELMAARERFYRKARWRIDTDGRSAGDVAREILKRLKAGNGNLNIRPG